MGGEAKPKTVEPLSVVLKKAGKRALGGGIAGALAMVAQVALLMWMRTVMNYQHANGLSTWEAITTLYAEGGLPRLYQGWSAALLQAPISRFGDTAANAGMMAILAGVTWMPEFVKTLFSSWSAAAFRIIITPIDAFKTTLQVQGSAGIPVLMARIEAEGILTLWSGALATSFATFAGHYPWFVTHNYLKEYWTEPQGKWARIFRNAIIGLCSSAVSDVVSNSIRVVKTKKQTAKEALSYMATISMIISEDGVQGLFLRGLGTKLITNGVSAIIFTILWKEIEKKLTAPKDDKKKQ
eukprot:CAMPEP_0119070874 /NCGR_PEP_ID=MMETSP1178-20130426/44301_1 /TAXON_ID=33656 /ORGANISM="unid sp, Strain CCMP2000" /LENGTH=295 /DNA_ID=CAMNT_0007052751 /DNA_START=55 /DNA_END=942 /DNA_ORIENTATION=+